MSKNIFVKAGEAIIFKGLIYFARKWNSIQDVGLKLEAWLDLSYGEKRSEQVQDEITAILLKICRDFRRDK